MAAAVHSGEAAKYLSSSGLLSLATGCVVQMQLGMPDSPAAWMATYFAHSTLRRSASVPLMSGVPVDEVHCAFDQPFSADIKLWPI